LGECREEKQDMTARHRASQLILNPHASGDFSRATKPIQRFGTGTVINR